MAHHLYLVVVIVVRAAVGGRALGDARAHRGLTRREPRLAPRGGATITRNGYSSWFRGDLLMRHALSRSRP